ncbi:hypothetical protein CN495_08625 [Bacillus thuringiensis]|uniref:Uncharacterized protein n=1 Tax=Bacillus thuringiensis TaxID=1428 RepID=A0ABD6S9T6_BACTU|nr:hypothetical protein [Bacillus thuringiensis]PER55805.1 hypothetical protein CN495_08625 [Bacillus thuringiensis]
MTAINREEVRNKVGVLEVDMNVVIKFDAFMTAKEQGKTMGDMFEAVKMLKRLATDLFSPNSANAVHFILELSGRKFPILLNPIIKGIVETEEIEVLVYRPDGLRTVCDVTLDKKESAGVFYEKLFPIVTNYIKSNEL